MSATGTPTHGVPAEEWCCWMSTPIDINAMDRDQGPYLAVRIMYSFVFEMSIVEGLTSGQNHIGHSRHTRIIPFFFVSLSLGVCGAVILLSLCLSSPHSPPLGLFRIGSSCRLRRIV